MAHGKRLNIIQQWLNRKVHMKKLILAVIVLSIGYFTMVKAEEPMRAVQDEKSVTPQEFVEAVASVPGNVGTHIKNQWADSKVYQANILAETKVRLQGFKEKFQAKKD